MFAEKDLIPAWSPAEGPLMCRPTKYHQHVTNRWLVPARLCGMMSLSSSETGEEGVGNYYSMKIWQSGVLDAAFLEAR